MSLKSILQDISDLRNPIKEDEGFYEGIDLSQLIALALNEGPGMPSIEDLIGPIADRFAEKHGGLIKEAAQKGVKLGEELI